MFLNSLISKCNFKEKTNICFLIFIGASMTFQFAKLVSRRMKLRQLTTGEHFTFETPQTMLLLGDSITQYSFTLNGFGARLSHWYSRRMNVQNLGFSGYNSRWLLKVLEAHCGKPRMKSSTFWKNEYPSAKLSTPTIATLLIGSNDCVTNNSMSDSQHISVEEYTVNVNKIIDLLQDFTSNKVKIILLTPPPVDEATWKMNSNAKYGKTASESNRLNSNIIKYAKVIREIASERDLLLVDLFNDMQTNEASTSQYLCDGLHLSEAGNRFVAGRIMSVIQQKLPELSGGDESPIPLYYPHWSSAETILKQI